MGKQWKQWQTLFSWAPKSPWTVTAATKLKGTCSLGKKHKPRQCIQKQKHHFVNKDLYSQSYGFSSSHVGIWELDHEEGWVPNNWCFQTVVWKRLFIESPLDSKEIKPVDAKGNQPWICWSWSSNTVATWCKERNHWGKDPDAGKDWREKKKGMAGDEMVR